MLKWQSFASILHETLKLIMGRANIALSLTEVNVILLGTLSVDLQNIKKQLILATAPYSRHTLYNKIEKYFN